MVGVERVGLGVANQFVGFGLQHGSAAAFDFLVSLGQIGEKAAHFLPDCGTGSQALVGRCFLAHPAPDGLVSVEVWTVAWQSLPVLDT